MVYSPSAAWTTRATASLHSPVYFLRIDGVTGYDFSTHAVKSPAVTKKRYMDVPRGQTYSIDLIDGGQTVGDVTVFVLDVDDEVTALVSTEKLSPTVPSLINRKATIYGGYADMAEADYPAIFTGRITGLAMDRKLTGYNFRLSDTSYLLDQEIMSNATEAAPITVQGNIVNLYWAILSGTFSTSHADFPLDSITGTPTGLGIASALINEQQLKDERDKWHSSSKVKVQFEEPENARSHLESEFFRIFQAFPAISGDGKLGLRFHTPPAPATTAPDVTETNDIVKLSRWSRRFDSHLNKFTYFGDYDLATGDYLTTLYNEETAEDTQNQTDTAETIEYKAESRWLRSTLNGSTLAGELAGRLRLRFRETPVEIVADLTFRKRNLEQGDVVAITHSELPNLLQGSRGVTEKLMTVVSLRPDFSKGTIKATLLDTGYTRYGVVAPAATPDYDAATDEQKNTFCWIGDSSNRVGAANDKGYIQL